MVPLIFTNCLAQFSKLSICTLTISCEEDQIYQYYMFYIFQAGSMAESGSESISEKGGKSDSSGSGSGSDRWFFKLKKM